MLSSPTLGKWSDTAKNKSLTLRADSVAVGGPAASLPPVLVAGNTGDMLGHVCGRQGPLARPLEAARPACSTTRPSRSRSPGSGRTGPNPDPGPKTLKIPKNRQLLKCFVLLENWAESYLDRYISPCGFVCDDYNLKFCNFKI